MKAVFFDLDGTLLDTLADIACACNAALESAGLAGHPGDRYRGWVGNGFPRTVAAALGSAASDTALLGRLVDAARRHYAAHLHDHTAPYPGIGQALAALACAGTQLGVLSNKPEDLTRRLVARFFGDMPFVAVHGAVPGRPLKPDPAFAMSMLRGLGLAPAQCLYVGDSAVDIRLARACGMAAAGVAWGFRGPDELTREGCARIFIKPLDLADAGGAQCP